MPRPTLWRLTLLAAGFLTASAQNPTTTQYLYDASGQLTTVIDSSGVILQYTYDAAGNLIGIQRKTSNGSLSILSFSPAQGGPGATVTIQGQGFSATPASNTVKFNGSPATVLTASPTSLTVTVPTTATSGLLSVTVGANTAASSGNFTVLPTPFVSSISQKYILANQAGTSLTVTGVNLSGATFSFAPATIPAAITITNAVTTATSATLTVNTSNLTAGMVLVAANAAGATPLFPTAANSISILLPDVDSDGDGLTNADELAHGTDPLNPDSDHDGMPDGWELQYGLNPLFAGDATQFSKANDGLTNLQEYKNGTDPTNSDRTIPSVPGVSPVTGATGVAVNSVIDLSFSAPILNPAQIAARAVFNPNVTDGAITVTAGGVRISGTVTVSYNGNGLIFTPSSDLAITTTYTITASGYRSLAGVPMNVPYTSTFTTSNQSDTSLPTVVRTSPFAGMTGVPTNSSFSVEFSKPVVTPLTTLDPNSLYLMDPVAGRVPGRLVSDPTGRIATFIPTNPLAVGRLFTATISPAANPIQDASGNAVKSATSTFTAGFAPDLTPPIVTGNSPQNGDTGIAVNTQVLIRFSKTVNEITAVRTISVLYNGVVVPGSFSFLSNDTEVLFTPANPYLPGVTTVAITPGLTDVAGIALNGNLSYSFTVDSPADTVNPTRVYVSPPDGATDVGRNAIVQVRFSERMNPLTATSDSMGLLLNTTPIPAVYSTSADRLTVTLTPSAPLEQNSTYCLYGNQLSVNMLQDLSGNPAAAYHACFTTSGASDTTTPIITSINPPNGGAGVPLNVVIVAQASKPLSPVSFEAGVTGVSVPLNTADVNFFDLGLFAPAQVITLTAAGTGAVGGGSVAVLPDGSIWTPALPPYDFGNPSANNYPQTFGGDGVNHFAGGGVNVDSTGVNFGFAGKQTTDTTDPAAIRLGVLVGTFSAFPTRQDWFPIGAAAAITVPPTAGGSHLYLAVNTFEQDGVGTYLVNYSTPQSGAPNMPITVSANGVKVPGIGSLASDGVTIAFSPSAHLRANTSYSVAIGGITDYMGNALTPFASTFATGASTDTIAPTVVSVNPPDGTPGVVTNSPVVITFSKLMNPLTVNATNIAIVHAASNVEIKGTLSVDNSGVHAPGAVVTFVPSTAMPSGSTLSVNVFGVEDLAGNLCLSSGTTFTTAGAGDTTPPSVTSVSPPNGATNLGLNTVVSLTFSKPLNPATVTTDNFALFSGTTRLDISLRISADYQTVTLSAVLSANVVIGVVATHNVTDLAGNPLPDFRSTFTTVPAAGSNPSVVGMRPPAFSSSTPLAGPISLFVSHPLDATTVNGALHISQSYTDSQGNPVTGVLVPGSIALNTGNQAVVFTPTAPFQPGAFIQVFFDSTALDTSGNPLNSYQSQLSAARNTAGMYVVTSTPNSALSASNPVIEIQFSQAIDPTTVNSANFQLTTSPGGVTVNSTVSVVPGNPSLVRIAPGSALVPGAGYQYTAGTAVKDSAGDSLIQAFSNTFINGAAPDNAQPRVSGISPPSTSTGIGANAPIEVLFNKPMNPSTINAATIAITSGGNSIGNLSITFGTGASDVILTPYGLLPDGATITVTVSGAQDLSGNTVVPLTATFQTRLGVDVSSLDVISVSPANAATNVPTNATIALQFDKPIDPLTVSNFSVTDVTAETLIAGTYSVSSNGLVATFVPSANFAVGRSIKVNWATFGLTDLAGNLITAAGSTTFTTALSASNTVPQVTLVSPDNGLTGVPINSLIQVKFNEPIQASSLQNVTLSADGSTLSGVVNSLSAGNSLLTISPPAILLPNTLYGINVAGPQDLAGHALNPPVSASFTTAPGADLSLPSVLLVDPPNGSVGIGTNVYPTILFNKRIDPLTFDGTTVVLYSNLTALPVSTRIAPSADRTSVSIQPASPLTNNTAYSLELNGVTDLEGNALSGRWVFNTGAGPDTTPPVILAMNPPANSVAPINVTLVFYASKPISPVSFNIANAVTLMTGTTGIAGTAVLGPDLQTITFQPNKILTASTSYSVKLSGFTDVAGNLVTPYTGNFSTDNTGLPDNTQPALVSSVPADASTNVPVNTTIVLNFSKAIDAITANAANIQISVTSGSINLRLSGAFATSGSTVTFTPASQIPAGATVAVNIGSVQDIAGNLSTGGGFSFVTAATADLTPPTVVSVTPPNNAASLSITTNVTLQFSKSLNPATLTSDNFGLFAGSTRLPSSVSYSSDATSVTLGSNYFPTNSTIQVAVTGGVQDLSGNALAPFKSTFTTGTYSITGPQLIGTNPRYGATGVPLTAGIELFFSQPLDPATASTAVVVAQNGAPISGSAALSGGGQVLSFTPTAPFAGNATIQIFVQANALEVTGSSNYFAGSFQTAADPAAGGPVITAATPPNNTVTPLNAVIEVQFNKPIDPATVNANVDLEAGGSGPTPATVSLVGDRTIRITPNAAVANTYYLFDVFTGVKDTTGLALGDSFQSHFITSTVADNTQPRVMSVSPPPGVTGIGVNASVILHFSEPVNPLTISIGPAGTVQLTAGTPITAASIAFNSNSTGTQDVVITPYQPFPAGAAVNVSVTTGVQDLAGNPLALAFASSFTTGAQVALNGASVTGVSPTYLSQNVPLNAVIQVTTDIPIDPGSINASTMPVSDDTSGYTPVAGTWSVSANGRVLSFSPTGGFVGSHTYSGGCQANDINGNRMGGCSLDFTTASQAANTPPAVTASNPPSGYLNVPTNIVPQVLFNEPILPGSITGVTLTPAAGAPLALTMSLGNGNQTLTLVPPALLSPSTAYTLQIAGIQDVTGAGMAQPVTITFTTGPGVQLAPPTAVLSLTDGATGISRTVAPTATFSAPIDPLSVMPQAFVIYNIQTNQTVPATLTLSADGLTLTMTLTNPLDANATYQLAVFGTVLTDLVGNNVASQAIGFMTGN